MINYLPWKWLVDTPCPFSCSWCAPHQVPIVLYLSPSCSGLVPVETASDIRVPPRCCGEQWPSLCSDRHCGSPSFHPSLNFHHASRLQLLLRLFSQLIHPRWGARPSSNDGGLTHACPFGRELRRCSGGSHTGSIFSETRPLSQCQWSWGKCTRDQELIQDNSRRFSVYWSCETNKRSCYKLLLLIVHCFL